METDCQELVKLWQADSAQRSIIYPILQQMRDISLSFSGFNLVYVSRSCNRLAHESAKLVNPGCVVLEWRNEIPLALRGIIESCNSAHVQ